MGKKKLLPAQKSPIVRSTTAKPIPGLSEAELTEGFAYGGGLAPSSEWKDRSSCFSVPFAGDDAE